MWVDWQKIIWQAKTAVSGEVSMPGREMREMAGDQEEITVSFRQT